MDLEFPIQTFFQESCPLQIMNALNILLQVQQVLNYKKEKQQYNNSTISQGRRLKFKTIVQYYES